LRGIPLRFLSSRRPAPVRDLRDLVIQRRRAGDFPPTALHLLKRRNSN
jgi:hypothetical protein